MRNLTALVVIYCIISFTSTSHAGNTTIYEYAKCSGILIIAAAITKDSEKEKSAIYFEDVKRLDIKARKIKGFSESMYKEISFNASQDYIDMIKNGIAKPGDFWSDSGYCRGLAQ